MAITKKEEEEEEIGEMTDRCRGKDMPQLHKEGNEDKQKKKEKRGKEGDLNQGILAMLKMK